MINLSEPLVGEEEKHALCPVIDSDWHRGHANSYDVMRLGFNYRMEELRGP